MYGNYGQPLERFKAEFIYIYIYTVFTFIFMFIFIFIYTIWVHGASGLRRDTLPDRDRILPNVEFLHRDYAAQTKSLEPCLLLCLLRQWENF